jgi:RNA polymerase sigma factor (sigma-70 family)
VTASRPDPAVQRTIEAVWRIEAARLIAGLARIVRDVGLAEDLAQDALVAALEQWPESGVPDNPGAWLMAVARRRGVDTIRRRVTFERKVEEIGRDLTDVESPMDEIEIEKTVQDDVLRLMFTACHPVLSPEARVALTLKMIGGLSTEEIARAFVVPVPTMAQRIVRAKKALADAGVPFEIVPGISAALAAPAAAGIPVTHRGLSASVTIVNGHDADQHNWSALAASGGTLVFLMAVEHLEEIVAALLAHGRPADEPAAVVHWATTARQRSVVAPLEHIAGRARSAGLEAPAVLVVGPTAALANSLGRPMAAAAASDQRSAADNSRCALAPILDKVDPVDQLSSVQ